MKNKTTAGVLALLLGGLGIHQFYLGKGGKGIFYLLFFWSGIPLLISIIDAIVIFTMSDAAFNSKYNTYLMQHLRPNITVTAPNPAPTIQHSGSIAEELSKLSDLKEKGIISEEEFQSQKNKMLK